MAFWTFADRTFFAAIFSPAFKDLSVYGAIAVAVSNACRSSRVDVKHSKTIGLSIAGSANWRATAPKDPLSEADR